MRTFLPCPLAPLLEPDSLRFDDSAPEPRRMLARVTSLEDRMGGFYLALLEENVEGDRLVVTDLVHGVVVGEFVRAPGVHDGATYIEEDSGEMHTIRVFWGKGEAVEASSLRRPSVA